MTETTNQANEGRQLCVKELAGEIGRHENFVYAMRRLGFTGDTLAEALRWIAENEFVIRRGKPMMKRGQHE